MQSSAVRVLALLALLMLWVLPAVAQQEPPAEQPAVAEDSVEPATVTIPAGTHLPLVLQNSVNTKTAAAGDSLYFESTYPVVVDNRILIPVGSFVRGTLTEVKRPGRVKGRGELHVRFDELTLPNGYTVKLSASLSAADAGQGEEVQREEGVVKGDSSKAEDLGTVATTTGAGTGIGAIATGSRTGAGIGAGVGAAAGLAAVLLTRGKELELPRGTTVEIVFNRPLVLDASIAKFDWTGQPTALPGPGARDQGRRVQIPRIPF
jgi:type IV secretion system protein VirB10